MRKQKILPQIYADKRRSEKGKYFYLRSSAKISGNSFLVIANEL